MPIAPTTPGACATGSLRTAPRQSFRHNSTRKHPHTYDAEAYKSRNLIERMFCRLKDFRRIATRYDKLARNFLAGVLIAAAITWWIN